ncbi:myosin-2 essential light chain [Hydra vulgaris]|uniref:myosin-2 essential light chain n=1 Tax=Hydra vulgaris TaxID=6087 RepID=UPI0001925047|nr:myosin-2 essential light chain [Hydra vulgaris]
MELISQRERFMLAESFSLYDTVGDGKIEVGLLGEALRGLGLNPTESDVNKIVRELESSGAKRITFEEFFPIYQSLANRAEKDSRKKSKSDFTECFRLFDREQNGTIAAGELHHVMTSLGETLTTAQMDVIVQGLEDKNGMINIDELVTTVMDG